MRRTVSADDENDTELHEEFNSNLMPHFDSLMVGNNVSENELFNDLLNTIGQPAGPSEEDIAGLQLDPFSTPTFNGLLDVVKREPVDDQDDSGDALLNTINTPIEFVVNGLPHSHKQQVFSGNRHLGGPIRHTHVSSVKSRPHAPHCPLHACGCSQRGPSHSNSRLHAAHSHPAHHAIRNGETQPASPFRPIMRTPTSPSTLSSLVHTVPLSGILNQQTHSVRNSLLSIAHPHELTPVSGASSTSSLHSSALGGLVFSASRANAGSHSHIAEEQQSLSSEKEASSNLQSRVIHFPLNRPPTLRRNGESDTSLFKRGLLASAFSTIEPHRSLLSADTTSSGAISKANSNACLAANVVTPIASSTENVNVAPAVSYANSVSASLQSVVDAVNSASAQYELRHSPTPTIDTESVTPTVSTRRKTLDKASDEYRQRRERNNVAVRKSREKAKVRHEDTNKRVKDLTSENDQLLRKLESVLQELSLLKSLFQKLGAPIPDCVMHASFTSAIPKHSVLARGSAFTNVGSEQLPADPCSTSLTATLCDALAQQSAAASNVASAVQQSDATLDIKMERHSPSVSERNAENSTSPTANTPAEASSTA